MKSINLPFSLLILLPLYFLFCTGCEKDSTIRLVNRTSYPLYAIIQSKSYTIAPGSDHEVEISTKQQTPLTGEVGKYVNVNLTGETYQIWDNYLNRYVDSTFVWVEAGKTISIYASPNRASFKVKNRSDQVISSVILQRISTQQTLTDTYYLNLPDNEDWYKQIPFATEDNEFHLIAHVILADGTDIVYGNPQTIIGIDEQFLIEVVPQIEAK